MFDQLSDKHSRRIFAFVNGISDTTENLQRLSGDIVNTTLSRYPTPIEFNVKANEMLERLAVHNSEAKCQEYARDLEAFKRQLYGKRQEYYEAFQEIERKAAQYQAEQASRNKVMQAIHGGTTAPDSTSFAAPAQPGSQSGQFIRFDDLFEQSRSERAPEPPVEVYRLNPEEAERYLREGRIEGDPYVQDGQAFQLTPEYLKEVGLGPEYVFNLGGQADIALSKVYEAQGHDAVTAYVRTDKGTQIVSYYRSNSQGGWRYLPDYINTDENPGAIQWFGKGYSEESLNLPAATQQALEIINAQPHADNPNLHSVFALVGTAKHYTGRDQYLKALQNRALRGTFYQEVSSTPYLKLGENTAYKRPPSQLILTDSGIAPDFSQPGSTYTFESSMYGPVTSEHFYSGDDKLSWTFNRDQSGRAWIGGIEVKSPIGSAGLHTQWAQAGEYGTPLYEYASQDGGYGDPNDRRSSRSSYVGMWQNYLSKTPLIQKYLAYKSRERTA